MILLLLLFAHVCFASSKTCKRSVTTPTQALALSSLNAKSLDYKILSNGKNLPLIGISVSTDIESAIEDIISTALSKDAGYALFDIQNKKDKRIVSQTISKLIKTKTSIHITTKISSNLNYNDAKSSMRQSLDDIMQPIKDNALIDLNIHFLLEKDPQYNWKESWKALNEMHGSHESIASMGVSNFSKEELMELIKSENKPHFYRGTILQIQSVQEIAKQHNISLQVHGLFKLLSKPKSHYTFQARELLRSLSAKLSIDNIIPSSSVAISYFTQQKIGVVSHTIHHIVDNSPKKAMMVKIDESAHEKLEKVMKHLHDYLHPTSIKLVIINELNQDYNVSWVNEKTNENVFVGTAWKGMIT